MARPAKRQPTTYRDGSQDKGRLWNAHGLCFLRFTGRADGLRVVNFIMNWIRWQAFCRSSLLGQVVKKAGPLQRGQRQPTQQAAQRPKDDVTHDGPRQAEGDKADGGACQAECSLDQEFTQ